MAKETNKNQSVKTSKREASLSGSTQFMIDQHLWLKILIGMVLGAGLGLALSPHTFNLLSDADLANAVGEWIALPGVLFLGLIQMVIIPLIVCSIILGIAESQNLETLGRIGFRIIPYFLATTAIAITIGILVVSVIQPGKLVDPALAQSALQSGAAQGQIPAQTFEDLTIPQRIANMIPTNPAKAQVDRDMLQIVIAAILVGIALITIPAASGKPFKDLCIAGQVLSMKIIGWAMAIAPYAVFGLLCNITIRLGLEAITSVGLYALCVLLGLVSMLCVYLIIIGAFSKLSIRAFLSGIKEVQLLAFSTSSSAATMPFSIQAAETKLKIRPEISRFVIPLGATINMDGTALYQAVAALFLCQVFGIELSLSETVLLLLTTIGASIGTPATPGVGLVVLATILVSIGVPPEGIALIIGVDRILDMCRTTLNVTGDLTASALMNHLVPKSKR